VRRKGAKYKPLQEFLRRAGKEIVELSFGEIEQLLGAPLPTSARTGKAFWSNRSRGGLQARAWMDAGYHVAHVDLEGGRVRFVRPRLRYAAPREGREVSWNGEMVRALRLRSGLTQAQLAELLGVRQQTISEWERGIYRPTRARSKHLTLVAEKLAEYEASGKDALDIDGGTV
jgi:predicted DNA-binding protein (UPF0251 family)